MLKEKILQNLNASVKGKKDTEVLVLRQILATVLNKEKDKRFKKSKEKPDLSGKELEKESLLTEEEVLEVVSYEAKKRRESISEFGKGGRNDLVEKEKKELAIIETYLPKQLSEEEIRSLVKEAVEKTGAKEQKDMGKVMAELMPKTKGRADGSLVSKIVKESIAVKS
ncbi:MAG: GatB/YqeY domain-containing protein [Candidatus Nealsonbacteria bacterium]|nr:GatB/YqeY domain-containing protein [Candidatus Nealsonbacteria bacterium]